LINKKETFAKYGGKQCVTCISQDRSYLLIFGIMILLGVIIGIIIKY